MKWQAAFLHKCSNLARQHGYLLHIHDRIPWKKEENIRRQHFGVTAGYIYIAVFHLHETKDNFHKWYFLRIDAFFSLSSGGNQTGHDHRELWCVDWCRILHMVSVSSTSLPYSGGNSFMYLFSIVLAFWFNAIYITSIYRNDIKGKYMVIWI